MLTIEKVGCFLFLGTMSLYDLKTRRLPGLSIILGLVSVVLIRIAFKGQPATSYLAAMVVGILFIAVSYITKEKIGYGDSLIILFIGILLGFENLLFIVFTALVMSAVTGVAMIMIKGFKRNLSLPFVPFMFAAFLLLAGFEKCCV